MSSELLLLAGHRGNKWAELRPGTERLVGWVDMHAHPMAHLAFGGKLIHGGNDVRSLLPTDADCQNLLRATSIDHALGSCMPTHGGWDLLNNRCGDYIRHELVHKLQADVDDSYAPVEVAGAPHFSSWPRWNDVTHQKMWVDWIRRAHWGGQRVMIALAVNNQTLAAAAMGPGDTLPGDERGSADLQIEETKAFVGRNSDFMEIARDSAELRRVVTDGKLAVVLGVELDAIGNFHRKGPKPSLSAVRAELERLYDKGVRYMFPMHLVDNHFGGAAIYNSGFDISNYRESGEFWDLTCSEAYIPGKQGGDGISFRYEAAGSGLGEWLLKVSKLNVNPNAFPPFPPLCEPGSWDSKVGHMNSRGITSLGKQVIIEMMRMGLMIDIDHMSQRMVTSVLEMAEKVPGGYPLNSGHNGLRDDQHIPNENGRSEGQIYQIKSLGGMFGLGIEATDAPSFKRQWHRVASLMGRPGRVALGSDMNGLARGPRPQPGAFSYGPDFPMCTTGTRSWDYRTEGVAHYGMLPDFIHHLANLPDGDWMVRSLNGSAESFAQMWERCEGQKGSVPSA